MIVTWRIALRIALIMIVAIVLQVSFFSYLSLFGTTPNIIPLVAVTLGLLGGSMTGAVCGFALGFLLDSVLLATLGISSLTLLGVGYLAGRYREGTEISNTLMPPILIGVLTVAAAAAFSALQLMLGIETQVSLLVLREIFVQGLLAFLFAIPFYPLIRRVLRPAIVDDVVAGRRMGSPIRVGGSKRPRRRLSRRRSPRMRRATGVS
jgi:rod shape-determining protein MreD